MRRSLILAQLSLLAFFIDLYWHTFFDPIQSGPLKIIGPLVLNPYFAAICLASVSFCLLYYLLSQLQPTPDK